MHFSPGLALLPCIINHAYAVPAEIVPRPVGWEVGQIEQAEALGKYVRIINRLTHE